MSPPDTLVLVVGTATDIGKTYVGGQVLAALRARGVTVAARKSAQSFAPDDPHPTDAAVLAAATGEDPDVVCLPHRSYRTPMAPPMAADALGLPVPTLDELLGELTWPDPAPRVGWLETVGGPRSPIGDDPTGGNGDAVAVADRLDPDLVVLVADAGLGTVNAVLLSVAPFAGRRVVTYLNRYDDGDDLHRRNRHWLETRQGLEVVVDPEALAQVISPAG